jgi:hypothetical protein
MPNQFAPARKSSYKRLLEGLTMKKDVQETFERALASFEKRQEDVRQRLREPCGGHLWPAGFDNARTVIWHRAQLKGACVLCNILIFAQGRLILNVSELP